MSFENDFDFGMVPKIDSLLDDHSPRGVEKYVDQIRQFEYLNKSRRSEDFAHENFNFDKSFFHRISDSPLSSAASISSTATEGPTSSYWHIPDKSSYLTSIAAQQNSKICAIGSGASSNNLFIYEVDFDEVTHHQTVSLPEIHSLKWVSPETQLGRMGNVLFSGHKNGVAHLTILPDSSLKEGQAEIIKRYNHVKHLRKSPDSTARSRSFRIKNLELTHTNWSCCPPSSLVTLFGDHLFMWEPNRSDVPLVMQKTNSTNALGLCNDRDGVYALGRMRGVCIRDIRVRDRVNPGLRPPVENDEPVTCVKWNPFDGGNQLAAVHDRTNIKIWDIRNKEPLSTFNRHADTVNSLEWSSQSQLVSASADGTVRVWDTKTSQDTPSPLSGAISSESKLESGNSSWNEYVNRLNMESKLDEFGNDLLGGAVPINQSHQFVGMVVLPWGTKMGALTIDKGNFLGTHELNRQKQKRRVCSVFSFDSSSNDFTPPF